MRGDLGEPFTRSNGPFLLNAVLKTSVFTEMHDSVPPPLSLSQAALRRASAILKSQKPVVVKKKRSRATKSA